MHIKHKDGIKKHGKWTIIWHYEQQQNQSKRETFYEADCESN